IRVDADEVTYNLHILLRFEIETALFRDEIGIKDLPQVWNAKFKEYLGLSVPNDAQGVLQDVHWSFGGFGYFPTYTLGNLIAAQLFASMDRQICVDECVKSGAFARINTWLNENIHRFGCTLSTPAIVERATGTP